MEATAIWMAPRVEASPSLATVGAAAGAVLYSETATFKQLAGTIDAPLSIDGPRPAIVPAGTMFSAWLVNDQRQACTSMAQDPARPGKPAYQLCLSSRGGQQMDAAILRKLGEKIDGATTSMLKGPLILKGEKGVSTASGTAWPGANIFTYRQSGGVGIITEYSELLLSPEITYERRLVVRKLTASAMTLRCDAGSSDDLSKPVSAQSPSHYKREETDVALTSGPVSVRLCGGQFDIARNGTMFSVTTRAPFASWWTFDAGRGQFLIDGEAFAYGAQTH
ncbi:hypothetical protein [Sphingobium aquiterrae]|uniref:hypothetical protein n=1 Tax=Sphingobium aquiterrae TaxID=2038656 RepID=UPI0030176C20